MYCFITLIKSLIWIIGVLKGVITNSLPYSRVWAITDSKYGPEGVLKHLITFPLDLSP